MSESGLAERRPAPGWRSRVVGAVLALLVPAAHAAQAIEPAVADPGLIYLQTEEAGIYRVTYEQLLEQGIDLGGVKHGRLALMHAGERVGVRSKGQDKAHGETIYFGPGGWIEFIADLKRTLYSKKAVYALHDDWTKRLTIARDGTNPNQVTGPLTTRYVATESAEYDLKYSPATSGDDPWYATRLVSINTPVTHTLPVTADNVLAGAVSVDVDVWGGFAGVHTVNVQLNDYAVGSSEFTGFSSQRIGGNTSHAALVEGTNLIRLTVTNRPGQAADIVHADKWSISYPRRLLANGNQLIFSAQAARFQMTGFTQRPKGNVNRRVYRRGADGTLSWLSNIPMPTFSDGSYGMRIAGDAAAGATYYVSLASALKQVEFVDPVYQDDLLSGSAKYLVISHPDFIDEHLDELISARQAQGYTTKVADVEAVYSAFDYGHFGADAIGRYIAWAHAHLGTEMVLLVGADTHDYHGNLGNGSMSFMPSVYVRTSDRVSYAPSDGKYADVDGDDIPDLSIGRMIPRTTREWANSVAKTLQYGAHPNPRSLVLAVDEKDQAAGYSFSADADATIAELPVSWQGKITRAYIDELGVAAARSRLIGALNEGQAVAGMFGHSGASDWSFSGLFRAGDAAALSNAGAPTVITQWGCWNTYYVAATEDTLAHEFMLNDLNGAAAVLGASTLTEAAHEREMAKRVYPRMFEAGKPIGQAILEAKLDHAQAYGEQLDVILGWNLLGDPALVVEGG